MDQTKAQDIKKRCQYPLDHIKSKIIQKKKTKNKKQKTSTSASLTTLKPLSMWIT